MIKELLEKRYTDNIQNTKNILAVYEENLARALGFWLKANRDIRITSVYLSPKNPHFVVNICHILLSIGDKLKLEDGTYLHVTEQNRHQLPTNELTVVLPTKVLEEGSAIQIYEQIKIIEEFVGKHGKDMLNKVIASGITHLNDLLKEENEYLLEEITNPISNILETLDELQQVQYHIFMEDENRRIH
jgi:archaellum component FlaF (FlaF/FlaG flagellin family)